MDIDPGTLCTWLRIRDCRIRAQTNWVFAPCVVATFSSLRSSHAYLVTTVPVAPCAFSSCCFSTNLKCESHRLRTHTDRGGRIAHQPEVNECAHANDLPTGLSLLLPMPADHRGQPAIGAAIGSRAGLRKHRCTMPVLMPWATERATRRRLNCRSGHPAQKPSRQVNPQTRNKRGTGEFLDGNTQNKRRGEEGSARGSAERKGAGSATLRWIIWITRPPAAGRRSQYINTSTRVRAGGMPTVSDHRDQIAQITVTSIQTAARPPLSGGPRRGRPCTFGSRDRAAAGAGQRTRTGEGGLARLGRVSETDAAQAPSRATAATHGARRNLRPNASSRKSHMQPPLHAFLDDIHTPARARRTSREGLGRTDLAGQSQQGRLRR